MNKFIQFYNVHGKNYTVNINYILTIESTNERKIFRVCIKDIGAIEINRNVYDYLINYLLEQSTVTEEDTRKKIKIDECSMSPRLANLMCNFGFEYLEDVYDFWVSSGDNGLLKKSSFGRKSLNELKDIFKEYKQQETK